MYTRRAINLRRMTARDVSSTYSYTPSPATNTHTHTHTHNISVFHFRSNPAPFHATLCVFLKRWHTHICLHITTTNNISVTITITTHALWLKGKENFKFPENGAQKAELRRVEGRETINKNTLLKKSVKLGPPRSPQASASGVPGSTTRAGHSSPLGRVIGSR